MKRYKVYTVDAFTNELFSGNPAGVVIDADGLSVLEMQSIALEINLSETAFVLSPQDKNNHFKICYFTPTSEIDFCGHATIALSWILGSEYQFYLKTNQLRLETNIGLIPIEWGINENHLNSVIMTQVEPRIRDIDFNPTELFQILGLKVEDYDSRYKIKCAYTGNWHVLIPVKSRNAIDQANPNYLELGKHNQIYGLSTTHLFTFDTQDEEYLLYTRDFAPSVGVNEDPVTGSANGALAGYLILEGILKGDHEYNIMQGNSLGRLGELFIKTTIEHNKIKVQVGGRAIPVIDGFILL